MYVKSVNTFCDHWGKSTWAGKRSFCLSPSVERR